MSPRPSLVVLIVVTSMGLLSDPASAQVLPPTGCLQTNQFTDPFLGTLGVSIPVNLDLGINTTLVAGTTDGEVGGGGLADSSVNGTFPDGCSLTTGMFVGGQSPLSIGQFNVRGPTVFMRMNGPFNRLIIGELGFATFEISGGALVDAASDPQNCPDQICNNFVANHALSTGFLTVTDPGSRLDTINAFVMGAAIIDDPGIVGGVADATVKVLNGGLLNTQFATISAGTAGRPPVGTERSNATVKVCGANSQWNSTTIEIAVVPRATGELNVCNGGVVTVGDLLRVGPGGSITGNGTINGLVINVGGLMAPGLSPGTLTVNGNVDFDSGDLQIELEGAGTGQFDVLKSSGDVTFNGGNIVLDFSNGFAPQAGESLRFVEGASVTGLQNATVEVNGLLPGAQFFVADDGELTAITDSVPTLVEPQMDFKPRSSSNNIRLNRERIVFVAILTTDDRPIFDATNLNPKTVRFGPDGARPLGRRGIRLDVDYDGDQDLLFLFKTRRTGISCDDTSVMLTAETYAGTAVTAIDSIQPVGCH